MSLVHSQVKFGSRTDCLTTEDWVPPEQRANLEAALKWRSTECWNNQRLISLTGLVGHQRIDWHWMYNQSWPFRERNGTSAAAVATGNILHSHVKNMPVQQRDLWFSHQSFMPMKWISEGPFCLPVLSEQAVVTDLPSSLKTYIQKKRTAKYNQQAWKAAGCWHRTIN
jgi:hypothetical protein